MAVSTTGPIEGRLWSAADELRANSKLKSSEYSVPVLGLIFLVYADHRFSEAEKEIAQKTAGKRRQPGKIDYQAKGVLYLPEQARLKTLLHLPERANLLDWRKRQESRASVRLAIEEILDRLPDRYTTDLYRTKCESIYQHVYDSYFGGGRSIYALGGV